MKPQELIQKAQTSAFYRRLLNISLWRIIPFNKPHNIQVFSLSEDELVTKLPYKRSNLNHIKGLHACGMATLAEFTTGLLLLNKLDSSKYRIIMKSLTMEYHYQGKKDAFARFRIDEHWLNEKVVTPLTSIDKIDVPVEVQVMDSDEHHLATGKIVWQIKDWQQVRTK